MSDQDDMDLRQYDEQPPDILAAVVAEYQSEAEAAVKAQASIAAAEPPMPAKQPLSLPEAISAVERAGMQNAKPMTSAQAKIEAVAALTASAYAKASELKLSPEEIAALQADFPDEAFKPGAAGKEHLIYIEHAFLRDRLNTVLGLGQWALIPRNRWAEDFEFTNSKGKLVQASRVYVEAMLLVRGCFVAEAVGEMEYYKNNQGQNYGDAVEGAKTAALRRCCKEFGIGLQAWKKDWGDGWWKRNPSGRVYKAPQDAPGTASAGPPAPRPTKIPNALPVATEAHRKRLLEVLAGEGGLGPDFTQTAQEFFVKAGAILETESLEDLPLPFCPVTAEQKDALIRALVAFSDGEPAQLPYAQNPVSAIKPKPKAEIPGKPVESNDAEKQPWYGVIVPVPRKGQTRDQYLKDPDTIGSLYEARHGTDDLAQEARQRLYGFLHNYEPKGWTKRDGTQMPPSEADKKFRVALDQFGEFWEKYHAGEKI